MPTEARRIAIVGGGSLGLFVGGRLARAGNEVHIAGRGREGLPQAVAAEGDEAWQVPARFLAVDELRGPYAQVVVTVKSHDLPPLLPALAALGDGRSQFVFLQNGVPWWWTHKEADGGAPPLARTVAVVVHHAVERTAPGRIRVRRTGSDRYLCGRPAAAGQVAQAAQVGDAAADPALAALVAGWQAAGIPAEQRADIRAEVWGKLMGNATLNPLSAITGATVGELAGTRETREVLLAGMAEIARIAAAEGCPSPTTPQQRVARAELVGAVRTSMLQDRLAGRRLETDALLAAPIAIADAHGIAVPVLRTLLAGLRFAGGR
ncbi:2-dehydropantoate 2-reductase [Azoarcus indigens]|uniref:2-dehydropantoate 2-reductase n=1 Tax=Azoarcus indigens TaxID=29545 RepID=A0A4R6EF92_9RHOO|nr:2-dehydropantoate 2-reductase [Azoarcus indigens]NMG63367.1 2-dehydropantoate 2-reductase [Azoarcus indigens]TDN56920.1 2-dehydropantoate 2-reductase [Azoarcus indigens]